MQDAGHRIQDGGLMMGDGCGVEVGLRWNASRVTKRCFVTVSVIKSDLDEIPVVARLTAPQLVAVTHIC